MSATTSSTSALSPKKPLWERTEAEKPRFIKEKDWQNLGKPGFISQHSSVKDFLGKENKGEIPTRIPNVVIMTLTQELLPLLFEATVDCIVEGRKHHTFVEALNLDYEEFRPHCRRILKMIMGWPGACASIALDKKTGQVVSTGFFCDWFDMRKLYDSPQPGPEAKLATHVADMLEETHPDQDFGRGQLVYAFWGTTRPHVAGENFMSMHGMNAMSEIKKIGYQGIVIIPTAPGMYYRVKKLVAKKGVGQGHYHAFFKDLGPVVGEDSPCLKITNPPGIFSFAYFYLYRGLQNQGSKL